MAKVVTLSRLMQVRKERRMSLQEVAEAIGSTPSRVEALETSLDDATPAELRDLAILCDLSVSVITGVQVPENLSDYPFSAIDRDDAAYGTLRLQFKDHSSEYPIDEKARIGILRQLQELDAQSEELGPSWLYTWTLDNKILFARFSALVQVELIGDDVEQMPPFEHPEVYQAIEDWEIEGDANLGPLLAARCNVLLEREGADAAIKQATHSRIVSTGGAASWHPIISGSDSLGYFTLELECDTKLAQNRFITVADEGYYREKYINLSYVDLIEIPANRYHRSHDEEGCY